MHGFEEQLDGRDIRNGGFSWTENLADDVFAPMIGAEAARLYQVLCRIIPEHQRSAVAGGLTISLMVRVSRLSQGTVHRSLEVLVAMGMVLRDRPVYVPTNKPYTYKLPTLRDLVRVGPTELLRRLPVVPDDDELVAPWLDLHRDVELTTELLRKCHVPPWNASLFPEWLKLHPKYKGAAPAGQEFPGGEVKGPLFVDAPAEHGRRTESELENEQAGEGAFQQPGGHVPGMGAARSREAGGAFPGGTPIYKENLSESNRNKDPLPPVKPGEEETDGGSSRPMLSCADCTAANPGFEAALPAAAVWVMRRLGITKRRLAGPIVEQLGQFCRQRRDQTLEDACVLMVERGLEMHARQHLLRHAPWSWSNFVCMGHWHRPLPYDERLMAAHTRTENATVAPPKWDGNARLKAWLDDTARKLTGEPQRELVVARLQDLAQMIGRKPWDEIAFATETVESMLPDELCNRLEIARLDLLSD